MIKFIIKLIPVFLISGASFAAPNYLINSCQDLQNIQNDLTGNYALALLVTAEQASIGPLAAQMTDATLINNQLTNITIKNTF